MCCKNKRTQRLQAAAATAIFTEVPAMVGTQSRTEGQPPAYSPSDVGRGAASFVDEKGSALPQLQHDTKAMFDSDSKHSPRVAEKDLPRYPGLAMPAYAAQTRCTSSCEPRSLCCGRKPGCGSPSSCGNVQHYQTCSRCSRSPWITSTDAYNTKTILPPVVFQNEMLQTDLRQFEATMLPVQAGEFCSRGKAKRAVKVLKGHLIEIETRTRSGGQRKGCCGGLSCGERQMLKRDMRLIVDGLKSEIRDAWRAAS